MTKAAPRALCLFSILLSCSAAAVLGAAAEPSEPLPPEVMASVHKAIERDHYKAQAIGGDAAVVEAANGVHGYVTRFTRDGIEVAHSNSMLRFRLRLAAFGYEGRMTAPATGRLAANGQRIENIRGALTEWYVNRPSGLEQGFTLAERPERGEAGGPLQIELEVSGAKVAASEDGAAALLGDPKNGRRLRYAGLKSWDAEGTALASRLEVAQDRIVLRIDDAGATYPVTVDPTLTESAKLTASDAEPGDQLGYSIAISGDIVVAGAPDQGVYVFEKPAGDGRGR